MDDRPDLLSKRQFFTLLWSVLVSPVIRQAPGSIVGQAGSAAWLSVLLAAPGALAMAWFAAAFLRSRRSGEGLGDLFCRALGDVPGRLAAGLCGLWICFYAGYVLRAGADRFISAVYPDSPAWLFMAVMLSLCLPAALGRIKTVARCAQIAAPALAAVFGLVFAFCYQNVEPDNLWPLYPGALPQAGLGTLPLLSTLSVGVWLAFLAGRVEEGRLFSPFALALLAVTGLGLLLCVSTVGTFGPELTEKLNYPFFVMIRSIRLFHLLERVEALVVAQWVAADFLLLGALTQAGSTALSLAFYGAGSARRPLTVWLTAALLALSAGVCAPTAFALRRLTRTAIPAGNAAMVFVLLPLIFLVGKLRKRL